MAEREYGEGREGKGESMGEEGKYGEREEGVWGRGGVGGKGEGRRVWGGDYGGGGEYRGGEGTVYQPYEVGLYPSVPQFPRQLSGDPRITMELKLLKLFSLPHHLKDANLITIWNHRQHCVSVAVQHV